MRENHATIEGKLDLHYRFLWYFAENGSGTKYAFSFSTCRHDVQVVSRSAFSCSFDLPADDEKAKLKGYMYA